MPFLLPFSLAARGNGCGAIAAHSARRDSPESGSAATRPSYRELEGGIVQNENGPLWYRGLAQGNEKALEDHLRKVLFNYKVERVANGHTFTRGAVIPRFDGKGLMIDVGLSRFFDERGRMACLEIEKGKPYALHRGTKVDLPWNSEGDLDRRVERTSQLDREADSKGK